ncbi:hypothetical protein IFM89_014440 [Coptis chinensis]|uniref:Uncharacterized protein n=1 Tax=Coptis chinensis TaxID=261450 RepID=A0A835I2E1_9MAGN|nr:hypothetical protein IFM89_014440 [Coptis chinensis]
MKRSRPENHPPQKDAFIPGRYISKRERAILAAATSSSTDSIIKQPASSVVTSPGSLTSSYPEFFTLANRNIPQLLTTVVFFLTVVGSISDFKIRADILSSLKSKSKGKVVGKIPERVTTSLNSHTKAVNAIQWSPTNAHLLASAGMDYVCVWNVWSTEGQRKARVFNYHNAAVKHLRWSHDGLSLLSCGYDCSSRLVDVEKGIQTQLFKEDQVLGVIKFHPDNCSLFISGGSEGLLRLWDIRVGRVVQEFMRNLGPILDIEFSNDAKQFISSSDISKSNATENSIVVWDVLRQVPLSNQIYVEAYSCPCIKHHPFERSFVAQSNGNYIAIFSSNTPFKLDKYKRYENHGVSGFPVKCDFSLDGEKLASGEDMIKVAAEFSLSLEHGVQQGMQPKLANANYVENKSFIFNSSFSRYIFNSISPVLLAKEKAGRGA